MQVLGMRDERHENENRERVRPPQRLALFASGQVGRQISDHQYEDEQRDNSRLGRKRLQPFRPDDEAPECQTRDGNRNQNRKDRRQVEIKLSESAVASEQMETGAFREMVDGD